MQKKKLKIIVILGPTASGKTKLAVELARRHDGEIISADSRQVYRGMDVGTGKDLSEYGDVKYHLIDVAEPMETFSLAQYKKLADAAIADIARRGKVPFLVGGSGLYLQAVVDNYDMAEVGADQGLRQELESLSSGQLFDKLERLNQGFASKVNESDRKNKRRLIRYIELQSLSFSSKAFHSKSEKYNCLLLGLDPGKEIIEQNIYKRLVARLENEDMIAEVDGLHTGGVTWQRLKDFGLEYRFVAEYLQERFDYDTMVDRLNIATRQFAKKQMTWFRRWEKQGRPIVWFKSGVEASEIEGLIGQFLS